MWKDYTALCETFELPPVCLFVGEDEHTPFTVPGGHGLKTFLGRKHSEETKALMREKQKGKDNSCLHKVVSLEKDGVVRTFGSRLEASNALGLDRTSVSKVMTGKRESVGGWRKNG
jgi:hypothetical protein